VSWIEKINTDFIIVTGDNKSFKPKWLNATKAIEYNVAEFNFPDTAGTLVNRGTPKGRKYNLELYFQGDNNLDDADKFEKSANDPRPWSISHPFYGTISVQPTDLLFDNSKYNITKITGSVVETIIDKSPKTSVNPQDKILSKTTPLGEKFSNSFVTNVKPTSKDLSKLINWTGSTYAVGKKAVKLTVDAEKYFNIFNEATAAVLKITSFPLQAMIKIQALINYPAMFVNTVKNRIKTLVDQFNVLRTTLKNVTNRSDKKVYEHNGGVMVAALTTAAVTNIDYKSRNEVVAVINYIVTSYNTYLADLDSLQTTTAGTPESYVPDVDCMIALNEIVNLTVSNLLLIAIDSKQERSVLVEEDTNIVLLAHRFYGLTVEDSTLDDLIVTNNIGLNELLSIKKGRKILYYV
jgi:hypothetical protein